MHPEPPPVPADFDPFTQPPERPEPAHIAGDGELEATLRQLRIYGGRHGLSDDQRHGIALELLEDGWRQDRAAMLPAGVERERERCGCRAATARALRAELTAEAHAVAPLTA